MNKVSKFKILLITTLFLAILLLILIGSFFTGYTVLISMIASLFSKTLSLPAVIIGIFLIEIIGIFTFWVVKKSFGLYKRKTGMKIIRNKENS